MALQRCSAAAQAPRRSAACPPRAACQGRRLARAACVSGTRRANETTGGLRTPHVRRAHAPSGTAPSGSPTTAPGAPAGSSVASSAATAAGSCAAGSFWPTGSRAARTGALNGLCAAAAASWAFAEGVRVRPAEDISAARVGTERQSGKSIGLRPIHLQGVHRAAALLTWPPSPIHLTK